VKVLFNKFVVLIWLWCIRHQMYINIPFANRLELSDKEVNMVVHILNNKFKEVLEINRDYCHIFNFLNFLLKHGESDECWQQSQEEKNKILSFYDMCKESINQCEDRFEN